MTRMTKLGLAAALLCLAGSSRAYAYAASSWPTTPCSGDIGYYEARVYTGTDRGGTCYELDMNPWEDYWKSWNASTTFPNDDIESAETGPGVTLVLYWAWFYTKDNGAPYNLGPNQYVSNLGSWRNNASAARVQIFPAGVCADNDRLLLFTNTNYGGDCTELAKEPVSFTYTDPAKMGFRNDTLSSIKNRFSTGPACLYAAANYGLPRLVTWAQDVIPNLGAIPSGPGASWNDITSSISTNGQCWR